MGVYVIKKLCKFIKDQGISYQDYTCLTDFDSWIDDKTPAAKMTEGCVLFLKFINWEAAGWTQHKCHECSMPHKVHKKNVQTISLPHCMSAPHGNGKWSFKLPYPLPECPICFALFGGSDVGFRMLAQHLVKDHSDLLAEKLVRPKVTLAALNKVIALKPTLHHINIQDEVKAVRQVAIMKTIEASVQLAKVKGRGDPPDGDVLCAYSEFPEFTHVKNMIMYS